MNNNAIPQTGGSIIASTLRYVMLCNPFLAADNEISDLEPTQARQARADTIGTSEQILRIVGFTEMTAANCNQFRKAACAAWNGHTDVEIDLSQTTLIDCAGVGALIAAGKLARGRNGVARLMNPTSSVQQLLELTRTGQLFDIVNTNETDPAAN
jgi:anti-anti-sigma factor